MAVVPTAEGSSGPTDASASRREERPPRITVMSFRRQVPGSTPELLYLDHNATTPVDESVLQAMMPYFGERFGNASSSHPLGATANEAVEAARADVAALVGARPRDVIFTSGATEANNLALLGVAAASSGRNHIVSCVAEHHSVLEPLPRLQRQGFVIDLCRVDRHGYIDLAQASELCTTHTLALSVMAANNETGVLALIEDVAGIAAALVRTSTATQPRLPASSPSTCATWVSHSSRCRPRSSTVLREWARS